MTDLQKLKALLDGWGVYYRETRTEDYIQVETEGTVGFGYTAFYTEFQFDLDGKFTAMGAWE